MNTAYIAAIPLLILSTAAMGAVNPRPQRPGLFAGAEEFASAREKIKAGHWAQAAWQRLKGRADDWLSRNIAVPVQGGGYGQHYTCPDCGPFLTSDENTGRHVCKNCGKTYTGEPYESAWRYVIHNTLSDAVLDLALAYQLSNDARYAKEATRILKDYAKVFPGYSVQKLKGKAFLQSLNDSVWIINLAWAYDLVAESGVMTESDKALVEKDLLKCCAEQIGTHKAGGNWQTWHNSAMASVGWCIGDEDLVRTAVEDPARGALYQIEHDFRPDGMQMECSFGYHIYALRALIWTLQGAWQHGLKLFENPRVKQMFLGPYKAVFPDGNLPHINDGNTPPLTSMAYLYETAYGRTQDPEIGSVLGFLYELAAGDKGAWIDQRRSTEALLFGRDISEHAKRPDSSSILPDLGLVSLRAGGSCAVIDFGPHGGGHGHPDKLSVAFYALGRLLAPDVGAPNYGVPTYRTWNRMTAAHNTVAINGECQKPAQGKLRDFTASPTVQFVDASCDDACPDTVLRRTLWLTPHYMVDFYHVTRPEDKPAQTDWFWHCWGKPQTAMDMKPRQEPAGQTNGYQHFTNLRSMATDNLWSVDWLLEDGKGKLRTTMLGSPGTEVIIGDGVGSLPSETLPAAIVRRQAASTVYRMVAEPITSQSRITGIEDLSDRRGWGMIVSETDGSTTFYALADGLSRLGKITLDKGAASACFDPSGTLSWLQFSGGKRLVAGDVRVELESPGSLWICREGSKYRIGIVSGDSKIKIRILGVSQSDLEYEEKSSIECVLSSDR